MKKILLTFLGAVVALPSSFALVGDVSSPTKLQKPADSLVLYVCGGNTGRSVMAEWYTRHNYSKYRISHGNIFIDTFSRGSGIDPNDSPYTEEYARDLIVESGDASSKMIALHRSTPVSLIDMYHANIILTMGKKYNDRLSNQIDRECSSFNLDYPSRSFNKEQWVAMCNAKDAMKAKIHTLVGCATGVDADIPDAYEQNKAFYVQTRNKIIENTDIVMKRYGTSGVYCLNNSSSASK